MLPLHRICFSWPDGYKLEIENTKTRSGGSANSLISLPEVESAEVADQQIISGQPPPLAYEVDEEGVYETLRLRENTEYYVMLTVPLALPEAKAKWEQSLSQRLAWPFLNARLAPVLKIFPPRYWQFENKNNPLTRIFCTLSFGSYVGVVDLSLSSTSNIRAEVASEKIGYYDDFKMLLQEVSEDVVELLFEVDNVAGLKFSTSEPEDPPPSVQVFHLRRLMSSGKLPSAVEAVILSPNTLLKTDVRYINTAQAVDIDPYQIIKHSSFLPYTEGGPISDLFLGRSPTRIPEHKKRDSIDTPENRFIKSFLLDLSERLKKLEELLRKSGKAISLREVEHWNNLVYSWLGWGGWKEVSELTYIPSNSQVLLRKNGYRDILEARMMLEYGLALPWLRGRELAEASADIRPIYELYEYWCYFMLRNLLRSMCGPEKPRIGDFYIKRENGLQIDIRKGRSSKLEFEYISQQGTADVCLFYNRSFRRGGAQQDFSGGSYSSQFNPDISIWIKSASKTHWLHFDAKYRLNTNRWKTQIEESSIEALEENLLIDRQEADLFNRSDLYKMHTYRDALIGSRGAYVLYPGKDESPSIFIRHRQPEYRGSYPVPSVGAFSLRPRGTGEQLGYIKDFITRVVTEIVRAGYTYQEEMGFKDE